MSALTIEERLVLQAPADQVLRLLLDPHRVVACLPGAQLESIEDDGTFLGAMKVKVGPVTITYKGKAQFTEVDEAAGVIKMVGEGREKGGAGRVKMTMTSTVAETDAGTELNVLAEVGLAGKIVRFGRGMIKGVSKQLFAKFGERVAATLALETEAAAQASPAAEPAPAQPVETAADDAAPAAEEAQTPEDADATDAEPVVPADEAPATVPAVAPAPAPTPAPALPPSEPVSAIPLLFKALWASITGFFRRLFGGGSR